MTGADLTCTVMLFTTLPDILYCVLKCYPEPILSSGDLTALVAMIHVCRIPENWENWCVCVCV